MAKAPAIKGLVAGVLVLAGAVPGWAQQRPAVTVDQMLSFSPRYKDVSVTTPAAGEKAGCTVDVVQDARAGGSGYLLSDAKKQPLRRYLSVAGAAKQYIWSYYKDGVEVYREIDSNGNAKPDQFRWLNGAGMKWGLDANEDGKIESWKMISAEEVGAEAFQALAGNDFDRLKALFITDADVQGLKLPAAQAERLAKLQKAAATKFGETTKALPNLARATFLRVETATPGCALAEHVGADNDVIKYTSREILYEVDGSKEKKQHEWLNTGEMIQVGLAWRLADVPTAGGTPGGTVVEQVAKSGKLQNLLEQLSDLDKKGESGPAYLKSRIALIEQIVPEDDAKNREGWHKQLFDNLSALAQGGDAAAQTRLTDLTADVTGKQPGTNLAAYGVYREMWTKYAITIANDKLSAVDLSKAQNAWLESLAKFVQSYPKADDTAEALSQLGIGSEFAGKDEEAVRWYKQIVDSFEAHPIAPKAKGSIERLTLVSKDGKDNKVLRLAGKQADGAAFDLTQLKGKAVVVYYWASYCNQCVGDFAHLKKLHEAKAAKDNVEIVCVNLDDKTDDAARYLKTTPVPGVHLVQAAGGADATGLAGPLAVQYGINSLPTMFLVGRDGKVLSRSLQVADLENELKKAQ